MKQRIPESGVQRACLDLLAAERIFHRRWNTGAVKTEGRFYRFGQCGDADILALPKLSTIIKGTERFPEMPLHFMTAAINWLKTIVRSKVPQPLWIECKSSTGKQTNAQELFQKEVEREGHHYLLVRDVDQLREWLRENGVIR